MSEHKWVKRDEIKDWGEVCEYCRCNGTPHLHYFKIKKSPQFSSWDECYQACVKDTEAFVFEMLPTQSTNNPDPLIDNGSLHPMRRSEYFDLIRLKRLTDECWNNDRCENSLEKLTVMTLNDHVVMDIEKDEAFIGWFINS